MRCYARSGDAMFGTVMRASTPQEGSEHVIPVRSRPTEGPSRRAILRSASMLGVAGGFLVGTGTAARATDFADDFQQAVRYAPGRNLKSGEATKISGIVIHWWGEPRGQSHQGVVNYLAGENARWSSAHYVVSGERVTQLVGLEDTAFHAGVYDINAQSIGIECRPEMDDATVNRVCDLVQKLNGSLGPLWLEPHQAFSSTGCPGTYMSKIPELKILAAGSSEIPSPPDVTKENDGLLEADGYWGSATTSRLQEVLGTPVDGVVSRQYTGWKTANPALVSGWEWVSEAAATGSTVIRAVQQVVGSEVDGLIGPDTIRAIQRHFGVTEDGCFPEGAPGIVEMQKALNAGKL